MLTKLIKFSLHCLQLLLGLLQPILLHQHSLGQHINRIGIA